MLRLLADHRREQGVGNKFWPLRHTSIALSTLLFLLSYAACSPPAGQAKGDASVVTGDLTVLHPDVRAAVVRAREALRAGEVAALRSPGARPQQSARGGAKLDFS